MAKWQWTTPDVLPSVQAAAGRDESGAEVPLPVRGGHPAAHHRQLLDLRLPDREPGLRPDQDHLPRARQPDLRAPPPALAHRAPEGEGARPASRAADLA